MSFILDAIAKSEAERKQRDVPSADVLAFPGDGPPAKRRTWPYLLAAAALALNGLLLYLLLQDDRPVGDDAPRARLQSAPATATAAVSAPVPSTSPTPAITDITSAAPPVEGENRPAVAVAQDEVMPETSERDQAATIPVEKQSPVNEDAKTGMTVATAESTGATDEAGWLRVEPDSLSREIGSARPAPARRTDDALFNRVVRPSELPGDLRAELPDVSFSGHLYSSNPRSSLVFIGNGRPVATGQTIEGDLVLHEITPNGVVVKFRGYLIEVGVLQNWSLK